MTTAAQATDPIVDHGEGPAYDAVRDVLHWVDMLAGDVLALAGDGTISRQHVDTVAAVWRPRTGGGAVVAGEHSFVLLEPDGSVEERVPVFDRPLIRMNDGGCDPQGRFYCGTMAYDETVGAGTVYRMDVDRSIHEVFGDVTVSNGLVWSLDGSKAFYIDTPTGRIDVFDFDGDAGTFHDRRPAVVIDTARGFPDGMTIDSDGGLWVALWSGSAVHCYTPDGELTDVIELPATRVTACTFGGPDLDRLYITTSRQGVPLDAEPLAGALFVAEPGVHGLPALPFAG